MEPEAPRIKEPGYSEPQQGLESTAVVPVFTFGSIVTQGVPPP